MKLVFTILMLWLGGSAAGCHSVPQLAAGMSVQEVREECGRDLHHQFSTLHDGAVITCLLPEERAGHDNHYLLFHDDRYAHATMVPPFRARWNFIDGRPIAQW